MAASMIPPPIVQSTYVSPPSKIAASMSTILQQPVLASTREDELHADLQYLLDAQAEGLLRGLESGQHGDGRSTGSITPTARSVRSASAKRPIRRKPDLRSARKGLYNTIVALSDAKNSELQEIESNVLDNDNQIAQIDTWEQKRQGLQEASSSLDEGEESVRAQRLQEDADTLQESINEMELQLADMKSRHRKLVRQIAAAENSTQAKLASYTQSMKMLETDVQKFLSIQPPKSAPRPGSRNGQTSVWQLPPKRRTLEAAREYFTGEREAILRERQRAEKEKEALEQGAVLWKEVAVTVTEFEKRVRAEMSEQSVSLTDSTHAWDETPTTPSTYPLQALLNHMDTVIDSLQKKVDVAEEHGWNLLIAAVGAELHALRQGKRILENALGQATADENLVQPSENDLSHLNLDSGEEIRELDKSFETARKSSVRDGDTDDEPDPELLFSKQDTDTE